MAHQFECDSCAFMVRSENDGELVGMVRDHADEYHDTELSRGDIEQGWAEVDVAADD
ncbi:hypothetical protein [Halosegnis marinus]|uniref:DUF1059 domain-containing protein n=1 Tax=Halosegnis marinus TaxID=3034023 RepID=A0ABD5ZKL7_9EURY|nr:hypothetical protein [Halosegnis sp. DT85]